MEFETAIVIILSFFTFISFIKTLQTQSIYSELKYIKELLEGEGE